MNRPFQAEEVLARVATQLRSRRLQGQLAQLKIELQAISKRLAGELSERGRTEKAHQETLERLEVTVNALPDMLFELDHQGRIHDFRAPRPELLYVPPEKFLGRSMVEVLPDPAAAIVAATITQVVEQGKQVSALYPLQTPAGPGWFEISIGAKSDTGSGSGRLVALVRDVTVRQEAVEQLRQQKRLLRSAVDALNHPCYVINIEDYTLELANEAARNLVQRSGATTCYAINHGRDRPCESPDQPCPLQQVLQTKKPVTLEYTRLDANGEPREVEVHAYPIFDDDGKVVRMIEYCLDITERKEVERARRQIAAAAERGRLARNLHDSVVQSLYSASLIAEAMPGVLAANPEEGQRDLKELRRLTQGALAEIRTLLLELRPAALTEKPLGELVDHLIRAMSNRVRAPITLTIEGDCPLPPKVQITFYRITQEALNNVARHAQATRVSITLSCQPDRASLLIHDDGLGFNPEEVLPDRMGLGIMRERVEHIGGALEIKSRPGHGTQIGVRWTKDGGRRTER